MVSGAFVVGLILGLSPREIGRYIDPYDAYPAQFAATFEPAAVEGHAELLVQECLPRLIAGIRLGSLGGSSPGSLAGRWGVLLLMFGFGAALVRLAVDAIRETDPALRGIAAGVLISGILVVGAFLANRNIYNSDNFRYLIFLLTPWCLGFGLCLDDLCRGGVRGRVAAGLIGASLAMGMTLVASRWYRETRHYLDIRGFPVRIEHPPWRELIIRPDGRPSEDSPASRGRSDRFTIPADVTHVFGGYWDVYRLSFLSGKRIIGVPYTMYPNRFPGWSTGLGAGRGKIMILRPSEEAGSAARPAAERPGGRSGRVRSARRFDWHPAMTTAWVADGRDPAELERLSVVVP
jgi:hypothetical protein